MVASRVAVVGGGLAGLSAALELKRIGLSVELFERSRLLGGKATSFQVDGIEVDNGQHVYLACCTEFIDFVEQLDGLSSSTGPAGPPLTLQHRFEALLLARGKRPARLRAVPLPAPFHLAPALLRYHHLSPGARLQVVRALLDARRPARPGETFAEWLDRHHQTVTIRTAFWDPFFVPALNAPLEEVSAEAALFVIVTAFLQDAGAARFGYSRVPLARIAEAAAGKIDRVHLRMPVAGLYMADPDEPPPGTHRSVVPPVGAATRGSPPPTLRGITLEDGSHLEFDGVVLAVPPGRLKRLLGEPETFNVFGLDDFRSAPIIDVHLWYDVPTLGFEFAALLDSPVQWVFEKGRGYVCCSMSAAGEYISWPGSDLVELCHRELTAVVPARRTANLLRSAATRDREATFVPTPGLRRPGPVTSCPQLVIAGSWTDTGWPATMESAVRSGRSAAGALAKQVVSH
jgi:hydroxysqualene dehydroxylase